MGAGAMMDGKKQKQQGMKNSTLAIVKLWMI